MITLVLRETVRQIQEKTRMGTHHSLQVNPYRNVSENPVTDSSDGWLRKALRAIYQFICGLQGHDTLLHYGPDRVFLVCSSCGHQSEGLTLDHQRPKLRFEGDAARHRHVLRPRIVSNRKIA
jgi:hypothetical protein